MKQVMVEEEFHDLYSAVTEVELFAAEELPPAQAGDIKSILDNLQRVELSSPIAHLAGQLLRKYRKSNGLTTPDAIIAASALTCGAVLATRNTRRYTFISGLLLTSPDILVGSESSCEEAEIL